MENDKILDKRMSFETAEQEILRNTAKSCFDLIFSDVMKMNLGDPIKDVLAYYTVITVLKDSVESTMKDLGISNLELVDKKEK